MKASVVIKNDLNLHLGSGYTDKLVYSKFKLSMREFMSFSCMCVLYYFLKDQKNFAEVYLECKSTCNLKKMHIWLQDNLYCVM